LSEPLICLIDMIFMIRINWQEMGIKNEKLKMKNLLQL